MEVLKERLKQTQQLQQQIQQRRKEVQVKVAQAQATRATAATTEQKWNSAGWNQIPNSSSSVGDLEHQFRRWEAEEELQELKRKMGR
jgi:hypothetical protein